MLATEDYAVLSTRVYNIDAAELNKLADPIPDGWSLLATANDAASGFYAQSFRRNDDIVIAFKGTNDGEGLLDDFLNGNIPAAFGIGGDQLDAAALFYQQIKLQYAQQNVNISFTGHSLGGGLASLMGVYFDKPATTFDQAPFGNSASFLVKTRLKLVLNNNSYQDSDLDSYSSSVDPSRRQHIQAYYIPGEAVSKIPLPGIYGSNTAVRVNGDLVSSIDLHSIDLLAALELSPTLQQTMFRLPNPSLSATSSGGLAGLPL